MRKSLVLLPILLAASCASQAWAGIVVYSNLDAGGAFNGFSGTGVFGSAIAGFPFSPGFSFTPASTAVFTELDIALSIFSGGNSLTVSLMSDAGGLPGGVLESWSVTGVPAIFTCCTLQTLPGSGATTLSFGTPYWVTVSAGSADSFAVWNDNTTSATGTRVENSGGAWSVSDPPIVTTGAFEVLGASATGTIAPEPGTAALVLAAGALALTVRRTSRPRS